MKSISLVLTMLLSNTIAAPTDTTHASLSSREEAGLFDGLLGGSLGDRAVAEQAEHTEKAVLAVESPLPKQADKADQADKTKSQLALLEALLGPILGGSGGGLLEGVSKREEATQGLDPSRPLDLKDLIENFLQSLKTTLAPVKRNLAERDEAFLGDILDPNLPGLGKREEALKPAETKLDGESDALKSLIDLLKGLLGKGGHASGGSSSATDGPLGKREDFTAEEIKALKKTLAEILKHIPGPSKRDDATVPAIGGNLVGYALGPASDVLGVVSKIISKLVGDIPALAEPSKKLAQAVAEIQDIAEKSAKKAD